MIVCGYCKAPVELARAVTGTVLLFDAEPTTAGSWQIVCANRKHIARPISRARLRDPNARLYQPHDHGDIA